MANALQLWIAHGVSPDESNETARALPPEDRALVAAFPRYLAQAQSSRWVRAIIRDWLDSQSAEATTEAKPPQPKKRRRNERE